MKIFESETAKKTCFVTAAASLGLGALLLGLHRYRPARYPWKRHAFALLGFGAASGLVALIARGLTPRAEKKDPTERIAKLRREKDEKAAKETKEFLRSLLTKQSEISRQATISDDELERRLDNINASNVAVVRKDWDQFIRDVNGATRGRDTLISTYALFGEKVGFTVRYFSYDGGIANVRSCCSNELKIMVTRILAQLESKPESVSFARTWQENNHYIANVKCNRPLKTLSALYKSSLES